MARLNVNPTRMELKKLKGRLATATRGHKLLKDKSDEMIRRFTIILRETKSLREEVEQRLAEILKQFSVARSLTSPFEMETAFAMPSAKVELTCETESIMGVDVPKITVNDKKKTNALPYAFAEITGEADYSVAQATELLPVMIRLAQKEKAVRMLAEEIERNKRRVNALEYVMIPQLEETIKYIKDKLAENERASVVRLMKVKANG
ncbi:MAG: V-type ATP synthase subunit D [Clostridia bacterium]|nr:V-type ATP synthase subunit D [Clostridia bacterium]